MWGAAGGNPSDTRRQVVTYSEFGDTNFYPVDTPAGILKYTKEVHFRCWFVMIIRLNSALVRNTLRGKQVAHELTLWCKMEGWAWLLRAVSSRSLDIKCVGENFHLEIKDPIPTLASCQLAAAPRRTAQTGTHTGTQTQNPCWKQE